jgi:hypothetical protein
MNVFVRVSSVEPIKDFQVRLGFTDGSTKEIDLAPYLHGRIFEPIKNDINI